MDLLKKYGSKELARLTYRRLRSKRKKKKIDIDCHIADTKRANYARMNDSRRKLKRI